MRKILTFLLIVAPVVLFSDCSSKKIEQVGSLIWSDEFNYSGLPDNTKWKYEVGLIRNSEPQYYTENRLKNCEVKDGNLVITAHLEDFQGAKYTSASINTLGKFDFTQGRIEVRAKLPSGRGVWPAIWTLGVNVGWVGWPRCGEIDIMEYWGHYPNSVHANVHTYDYNHTKGNGRGGSIIYQDPWKEFHVFAVEWFSDKLDFYLDEYKYYSCPRKGEGLGEWPFVAPQYLLLNLALIGGSPGIDDSIFPVEYQVDYVRIYGMKK